jgi:hypothetical protein
LYGTFNRIGVMGYVAELKMLHRLGLSNPTI